MNLRIIVASLATTLVAGAAYGTEYFWTNTAADNDYLNGDNWTSGDPPVMGLPVLTGVAADDRNQMIVDLSGDDKAVLGDGVPPNVSAIRIGYNGTDGELEQTAGNLVATLNSNDASRVGRNGQIGSWTMSGGTASINAIQLGLGGGVGNMTISAGDLVISRGVRLNTISTSLSVGLGGEGNFTISGGSILTRTGTQISDQGTFEVIGTGPTGINFGGSGSIDGFWIQEAGGILRPGISSDGVTPIQVTFVDGLGLMGDVTFRAGAILDPYDAGDAKPGWNTVMTWGGTLIDEGLVLSQAAIDAGWEMRVVEKELQVKTALTQPFQVNEISFDAEIAKFSLAWNTTSGFDYTVYYSDVLTDVRSFGDIVDGLVDNDVTDADPAVGSYLFVFDDPAPEADRLFFTVEEN
ncbi:hypothetical protein N9A89_06095 [Akkermansiaceae bacterium]|nr:hypothetical protein [Akkermansiaceae bacterium]MDB4498892.1 hypothetical protein [Akkermansiaceae bacterium]